MKKYHLTIVKQRKASGNLFRSQLDALGDGASIQEKSIAALKSKGRVYMASIKDRLIGLYIFEWVEHYFEVNEEHIVKIFGEPCDFDKAFFGESQGAYRLTVCMETDEAAVFHEKIEKELIGLMKEQIGFGNAGGAEFTEKVLCRKNITHAYSAGGLSLGIVLGAAFGYLLFEKLLWCVIFGIVFGNLFAVGCPTLGKGEKWQWCDLKTMTFEDETNLSDIEIIEKGV